MEGQVLSIAKLLPAGFHIFETLCGECLKEIGNFLELSVLEKKMYGFLRAPQQNALLIKILSPLLFSVVLA